MKIIVWTACIFLIMNMGLGQFGPSFAPGCPSCTCVNDEGVNVSFVQVISY